MTSVDDNKRALVLFSGGLDSTTTLAYALSEHFKIIALTINYKQRHCYEIEAVSYTHLTLPTNREV